MSPILATIAALSATVAAAILAWLRQRQHRRDRARLHCALAKRFPWLQTYAAADDALHHDQPNRPTPRVRAHSLYATGVTVLAVLGVLASAHTAATTSPTDPHRLPTIGITDPPTHEVSTSRTARAHRPTITTTTPPTAGSSTLPSTPARRPTVAAPSSAPDTATGTPSTATPPTSARTNPTGTTPPQPAPAPDAPADTTHPADQRPDTRPRRGQLRTLVEYSLELLMP